MRRTYKEIKGRVNAYVDRVLILPRDLNDSDNFAKQFIEKFNRYAEP